MDITIDVMCDGGIILNEFNDKDESVPIVKDMDEEIEAQVTALIEAIKRAP